MLSLLGDLSFNGLISNHPEQNIERFFDVASILHSSDLVFANLEVPVKGDDSINELKKLILFSLPQPTRNLLKTLNIGIVSLANNHIYDCAMPGLLETIRILDELGIYHTGAGWKKEHIEPVIINHHGTKIGFLAYVDKSTNPKTEDYPGLLINYLIPEQVLADIKKIRSHTDKIICSIHWGNDYSNFYSGKQQRLAHEIIDAGADIIMGHHPHTIQTYEVYNNKIIFYSLGQLCFGDFTWEGRLRALKRKTKLGMIIKFNDFSLKKFDIIPTKEKGETGSLLQVKTSEGNKTCWLLLIDLKSNTFLLISLFALKKHILIG